MILTYSIGFDRQHVDPTTGPFWRWEPVDGFFFHRHDAEMASGGMEIRTNHVQLGNPGPAPTEQDLAQLMQLDDGAVSIRVTHKQTCDDVASWSVLSTSPDDAHFGGYVSLEKPFPNGYGYFRVTFMGEHCGYFHLFSDAVECITNRMFN